MTGKFARGLATLACLLVLTACSLPRGAALQSEVINESSSANPDYSVVHVTRAEAPKIANWPATGSEEGYRWLTASRGPKSPVIRTGDQIDLVIWDSQENSLLTATNEKVVNMRGLVVSSSGTIFVPYVDEVVVSGQTPDQARKQIQDKLSGILPSAQVQLGLVAGGENSVDVVSGVLRPGTYPLPNRDTRILGVISQAGGIIEAMRNPVVRLMRDGRTYRIPAKELLSSPSRNILIRGGDQIVVEKDDRFFMALGATGSEQLIYFDREKITALEAMSMVGGISDNRADPQGVLVLREYPSGAVRTDGRGPAMTDVIFVIDLTSADGLFAARNFRIYPKDTVLVTESPITAVNTLFNLVGRLFYFGNQIGDL